MKLKSLETFLQSLEGFRTPKVELEQYVTSAHLASRMIFTAHNNFNQILNKSILDLGSGTGLLSIACSYLGSKSVLGVELDTDAIEIGLENLKKLDSKEAENSESESESEPEESEEFEQESEQEPRELESGSESKESKESKDEDEDESNEEDKVNPKNSIEFIQLDLSNPNFLNQLKSSIPKSIKPTSLDPLLFDTVVMNPPFGTKRKGIDMVFLEIACQLAKSEIYSLHKSSTRDYIQRKSKQWGFNGQVIAEMRVN